jgi:preprotein translocase subunit SecG
MKTAIANDNRSQEYEQWSSWSKTTRFIVDSYHYINHKATDEVCRTYCNPTPSDGSAPNLVGEHIDEDGTIHAVREFNTEASEQLNSWLAGFESILKRMTITNFTWFLHVMLLMHGVHVISQQAGEDGDEDDEDEDEDKVYGIDDTDANNTEGEHEDEPSSSENSSSASDRTSSSRDSSSNTSSSD